MRSVLKMRIDKKGETFTVRKKIALAILLVVVVSIVYSQTLGHDFLNYDDQAYVTDNNSVKSGLSRHSFIWAFTTTWASNWHPLTWISHMLDYELYGLNPAGHHLTNVLFHSANTLLLLYLLYYTTGMYWRSFFVAALFALHPLHVESVAWVAERKDVLSTFFMLGTLLLYSLYCNRRRGLFYVSALFVYAAGLMSKPMLVTLPFVLLLWDIWPLGRLMSHGESGGKGNQPFSRIFIGKLPFFILSLISCVITYSAQHRAGAVAATGSMPFSFRTINALISYVKYLWLTLWPSHLAVIYPLQTALPVTTGLLAGAALLIASVLIMRLRLGYPYLLVGWFWYLGTLVPVIGLVQVGQQAMADRYTYIPLIGVFVMIAWGGAAFRERVPFLKHALTGMAAMVLVLLAICSWRQIGFWKNSVTLFEHAVSAIADNHIAYRLLGNALAQQNDFTGAERAFQSALRIRPDDDLTLTEWGAALAQQKRDAEAIECFTAALRINPDSANAHYNLGAVLAGEGRQAEAIGQYREALKINPDDRDARNNLAGILLGGGKISEAIYHYKKALLLDPANAGIYYSLGLALSMQGDITTGIAYFKRAIAIRPAFAEAHYNLGIALIRTGNVPEAIRHFKEALSIDPGFDDARKSLKRAETMR